jgi:hypothetical protein
MAHVTFIHGISNKPPADDLLRIWREALASAAEAFPLGDLGVTSAMVYWADLLYEKAEEDLSAYEGVLENSAAAIDGAGAAPPPVPRTPEEAAFLEGLRAEMTALTEAELATTEPPPVPAQPQGALERVPCPGSSRSLSSTPTCAMSTTISSTSSSRRLARRLRGSKRPFASASSTPSVAPASAGRMWWSRTAWAR